MPCAPSQKPDFPTSSSWSWAPTRLPAGTPGQVESLGRLSRERLAEVYRACDAMIVPARGEGFPLAAQEALASGLPLLLADDPGYAPNLAGAGPGVRTVEELRRFRGALWPSSSATRRRSRRPAGPPPPTRREAFSWARAADQHEALYESFWLRPAQPS